MQNRSNGIRESHYKDSDLRVELDKIQIKSPDRIQVSETVAVAPSRLPGYVLFGFLSLLIVVSFLL